MGDKRSVIFIIDLDALNHDGVIQDHLGRTVAEIRYDNDVCVLQVENTVDAIHFRGRGSGKHFTIHSKVPCTFLENKLHFADLILKGGPYHFSEGSELRLDALEIEPPCVLKKIQLVARDFILLHQSASIEDAVISAYRLELKQIDALRRVALHCDTKESICNLTFSAKESIEDVLIKADQLLLNSVIPDAIIFKKIRASFTAFSITAGRYHFFDSQLQDKQQTAEQLERFTQGLSSYQFHEWHRHQSIPMNEEGIAQASEVLGTIRLTRSSILLGQELIKGKGAHILAEARSVVGVQNLLSDDLSADQNDPTLKFHHSLLVAQNYSQSNGHIVFEHAGWSVANNLSVNMGAMISLVDEAAVMVGNKIYLNNVDWYSDNSVVSARDFTAVGKATAVVFEDTVPRQLNERRVSLKVDHLSSDCRMGLQNVIARIGTWGHQGDVEYRNATVIVDKEMLALRDSRIHGTGLTLQSKASYMNGKFEGADSTVLITRDACVVGENGKISLRGRVIGRFGEWLHLGKLHVEQDMSLSAPLFTAKEAILHKGSQVTGEHFSMDVDDVTLSGEIDVSDTYRLITKAGMLKGSITSNEGIDLAADYLLMNIGGRLNARDVRIVGNYLGFLGEVQAGRSYSRTGGFMLDADLVFANNVMTTALVSASFGVKLPNPNSRLDDLFAFNNLIRAGLTVLSLTAPHVAPIANAAYFASKIVRLLPSLMQILESGSLEQIQQMRPHQWLPLLSYLGMFGLSGYQEFAHFHLNEDPTTSPDFEKVMTRLLPAFVSGEMNNSLLIVNGGLNLLPSSLNNAVLVEDAGVNVHVNDSVNAVMASHSGLDVAVDRVETVDVEAIQGAVVNHIHTLFAHHVHIAPRAHEVVTERAEWRVADVENEGTLTIHSSHHDSVLQVDHFDNQHKASLTNVTVEGFQFTNQDHASEHLHDVAFRNTLHVDNGQTSYTGYYVIQTAHFTQSGERHALDTKSETIFSLKSDDAEFQGVVRDSKVHIEVKHLNNVEDFLQGRGAYADFHVITALELVTQQALVLHGLDRDCDISITAPGIHFDQDVKFDHNVFLHSTGEMNIEHTIQSSQYLFVEANGNVVLRSEQKVHTDPFSTQPSIDVAAKEGLYIKSDHGEVIGEGLHADGKTVVVEGEKDVTLSASTPNPADYREAIRYGLSEALANASPSQWPAIIAYFQNREMPSTPSQIEGEQVALVSHQGNVFYNGQARASDTIQFSAPEGHVTVQGALAGSNQVSILADTGFSLLSEKRFKYGSYGPRTVWDPSQIMAGKGGIYIDVKHGDVIIDSSDLHAKGVLAVQANNITSLAHTDMYTSNVEHHDGFLGFSSHEQVTQTTAVFRSHMTSDSQVVFQARNMLRSEGGVFQGREGTYLSADQGALLYDVVGHTQSVDRSSAFWGVTYDKITHDQEFNVPTSVFDSQEIGIQSKSGDVIGVGSYIVAPNAIISGENVLFYGRTLNNQWSHESRGLHISAFGIPIFSSHTTYTPFQYGNATVNNMTALSHSHGPVEVGLNTMNLGIDAYNTVESIQSGLTNGNLANNFLQQEGLNPSVEVGLQITHQSGSYQSLGCGGIYAGNLTVNAQNRVLFDGLPVVVTYDAYIHAHQFDQFGTSLNAQYSANTQDITLGFTPKGLDHVSLAASASMSQSQTFVNQQFLVGGHLDVGTDNWILNGANTNAGRLTGHVSGTLAEKTELSTSKAHSMSAQVSTLGNIGVSISQEHNESIDGVTSIHAQDDATIDAHTVSLEGAKITSDKKLDLTADTIIGESVQAHSSSDSYGISGSLHSFGHHTTEANAPKHIDTVSVTDSGSRHDEMQHSVIHGEGGTNLQTHHIYGSIDTQDSNGSTVNHDRHWDYRADIPTGFESGGVMHAHPTEFITLSNDQTPVSMQQDVMPDIDSQDDTVPVSAQPDAVLTEAVDHVADRNNDPSARQPTLSDDGNAIQSTINPLDFMEGSTKAFSRDKLAVTPEAFEDHLPALMDGRDTPLSSNEDTIKSDGSFPSNTSAPSFSEQLGTIWNSEDLSTAMKVGHSIHFVVYQGYGYVTQNLPNFSFDASQWNVFNWNWSSLWSQSFGSQSVGNSIPLDVGQQLSQQDVSIETAALNNHHSISPEVRAHDSIDGSTVMFRKDKITITYQDLDDRMPVLVGEGSMSSQRTSNSPNSPNDPGAISIYDVNRDTGAVVQPNGIGACVYDGATGRIFDVTSRDDIASNQALNFIPTYVNNNQLTYSEAHPFKYFMEEAWDGVSEMAMAVPVTADVDVAVGGLVYGMGRGLHYVSDAVSDSKMISGISEVAKSVTTQVKETTISLGDNIATLFGGARNGIFPQAMRNVGVDEFFSRRAYLNAKFGRIGDLNVDITLRGYMYQSETLDVSTVHDATVFYSGYGNRAIAEEFSRTFDKTTLEMTTGGRYLDNQNIDKILPRDLSIKPWVSLSERYAQSASGEVYTFIRGAKATGIFNTVELPALLANPNVTEILERETPYIHETRGVGHAP